MSAMLQFWKSIASPVVPGVFNKHLTECQGARNIVALTPAEEALQVSVQNLPTPSTYPEAIGITLQKDQTQPK